ncbi:MAG: adenine phosphoribosyltransferase [Bathelium mastoideum]|nr:MAG: adenine phosphoribosyltransferase [Bathelium mastoideum]KAI9692579.1 MAG: adenine phosphoribosyltransferase [Bathelium mastoideum]
MSAQPLSFDASHPPHGHPDNVSPSTQPTDKPSTAAHPPPSKPDPTTQDAPQRRFASSSTTSATEPKYKELASLKINLRSALRQFPDFPSPGILFEDILPIFARPSLHESLIHALEIQTIRSFPSTQPGNDNASHTSQEPPPQSSHEAENGKGVATSSSSSVDVIVGLEARGFLFGPSLALRLGAGFVPVRKQGKLPGPTKTASYQKEYGEDFFQLQADAIKPGQKVLVVDDIIATGGSAAAAGSLVRQLGGTLLGYIFILELDFLNGRAQLDAPVHTLLATQEKQT